MQNLGQILNTYSLDNNRLFQMAGNKSPGRLISWQLREYRILMSLALYCRLHDPWRDDFNEKYQRENGLLIVR